MALREFTDAQGRTWKAWEVHPASVERRLTSERRRGPRPTAERRSRRLFQLVVQPELRAGWLVLQSGSQRRRVVPIPPGWVSMRDEELLTVLQQAAPYERRRRLRNIPVRPVRADGA